MPPAQPQVRTTQYRVSCLPETHELESCFTIVVQYAASRHAWCLMHRGAYLDAAGEPSWGPHREDGAEDPDTEDARRAWDAAHFFDHDTALSLARSLAATLKVVDWTAAQVLARDAAGSSR